jgi:hypothetical protein
VRFLGPKWHSPFGSMPFHRAKKTLEFQGRGTGHGARGRINHRWKNTVVITHRWNMELEMLLFIYWQCVEAETLAN